MIAFGHTAFGAAIGVAGYELLGQTNPFLGLVATGTAGFLAHYLEDAIPHGHFFPAKDFRKKIIYVIIFDLGLSIAVFLAKAFFDFGFSLKSFYILVGIIGSQLPDTFDGFIYLGLFQPKGIYKLENKFHNELIHWHGTGKKTLTFGIRDLWQLAVVLAAFFLI